MQTPELTYTFNKTAKTITFGARGGGIRQESIMMVFNATAGVIIYNPGSPSKGGTVATNVLTLEYDTSAMNDSDKLIILYNDPTDAQPISAASLPLPTGAATQTTLAAIFAALKAEDAAAVSGDLGMPLLAMRYAADTTTTSDDGDYTLLSRLTSTRAGNLDNLDATVNSRLASSSYTAPDNSGVAAIKAKTDQFAFTTPNKVDASATISGTLDANVVQISGSTTAADNLRKSLLTTRAGTVLAGSTATSILTDLTESTTDLFKSRIIVFYSGGAAYATGDVTGYNGTTKTLTVSGLSVTPSTSDAFILL